jgi:hypothetical protein
LKGDFILTGGFFFCYDLDQSHFFYFLYPQGCNPSVFLYITLGHHALLFYIFLVLVGDRKGLSYYPYDKISDLLKITVDDYIAARNDLLKKDLIAFDGRLFQVLSLPKNPIGEELHPITDMDEMMQRDPATIHQILREALSR